MAVSIALLDIQIKNRLKNKEMSSEDKKPTKENL
jgi:hypothetical protein